MQSLFDQGPPAPCPSSFNMAAYVLGRAAALGDKPALSVLGPDQDEDWSYGEILSAVRATAGGFLALGLTPGARVLMRLGNTVDFPIAFLASIAAGLVPVPASAQLTQPEIEKIACQTAPALIVAAPGISRPATPRCPVIKQDALRALRTHAPAPFHPGDPDRPAYIVYTSGTSGQPRAVVHAHRAIWARRMMWQGWYGIGQADRLLHAGGFNWTYTLGTGLMDPWTVGATALIPVQGTKPDRLAALMKRKSATIFAAAPGIYRQILKTGTPMALPELRHGLSAGEKLPDRVRDQWTAATGTKIYEAYGMSECSTFVSASPDRPAPDGASGYPQTGRRVAVLDEAGDPVPFDTPGVLAVSNRDPGLMLGYLDAEAETASRFAGEWFLTGDTVSMARDGAITYQGRADDMMNAGGFRVSPLEVEKVLNTHPDIGESAAVEVTVKADTSVIAAFYTADAPLQAGILSDFTAERLAKYKIPRIFEHVSDLPKGANGKLLRRRLRETYEDRHGQT